MNIDRKRQQLLGDIEHYANMIKHVKEVLAELPNHETPKESMSGVISFSKRFNGPGSKVYWYGALRTGGMWYLTGKETKAYTWPELAEFIRNEEGQVVYNQYRFDQEVRA